MTEPERAALDHIRRVVDSVIGEAVSTPAGGPNILPVPYVAQLGAGADQFNNDSGAAAGAMLLGAYLAKTVTPDDFFKQSGQKTDTALSFTHISNVLTTNGLPMEMRVNLKLADLALILTSGRPPILLIKQAVLQQVGLSPETYASPHYVVAVGMDMKQVYIHDPLRKDNSGQAQGIPLLTLYQAWTQGIGYERAALVPRTQLVRRVRVTAATVVVRQQPAASAAQVGTVRSGEPFEITTQKNGWGLIGENRWIMLSSVADI